MNVATRRRGSFFDPENPARCALPGVVCKYMPVSLRFFFGTIIAIRKFRKEKVTIEQLISYGGSITKEGCGCIDVIVKIGRNLIVSGATSRPGKTLPC